MSDNEYSNPPKDDRCPACGYAGELLTYTEVPPIGGPHALTRWCEMCHVITEVWSREAPEGYLGPLQFARPADVDYESPSEQDVRASGFLAAVTRQMLNNLLNDNLVLSYLEPRKPLEEESEYDDLAHARSVLRKLEDRLKTKLKDFEGAEVTQ